MSSTTPGVYVTTAILPGTSPEGVAPAGTFFVMGISERGPVDLAYQVNSLSDFQNLYGDRVSYGTLYDQLNAYFNEGGISAYVYRVVGTSPTKGTLTFADRAGSPVSTLKLDAKTAGAWSTGLTAQITNGVTSNTFRVLLYLKGSLVYTTGDCATPAIAVAALNASAVASNLVLATDLASATASPNNNPAVLAATALSAGTDDRGTIGTSNYTAALAKFDTSLGAGAVAIPGQTGATIWEAIADHCGKNDRIALLAFGPTDTPATVITNVASMATPYPEFCAFYYPYINISDGAAGTLQISPEGYVAGVRAKAQSTDGPWRAPAGEISSGTLVLSPVYQPTAADLANFDAVRINPIRTVANTCRIYGVKSYSTDSINWNFITQRDTINYLVVQAQARLEPYVFTTIDNQQLVFSKIVGALVGLCEPIRTLGGLFELRDQNNNLIDPGYDVVCNSSMNPPDQLAQGIIHAQMSVRVSAVGQQIDLLITKSALTSAV